MSLNIQSPSYQDDEISLYELWLVVKKGKLLFCSVAGVVLIVMGLYMVFAPRAYESKIIFMPPHDREVLALNAEAMLGITGPVRQLSTSSVYNLFLEDLSSYNLRMEFFRQNDLESYFRKDGNATEAEIFEEYFDGKLTVVLPDKKQKTPQASLSLLVDDAVLSAKWANAFVALVKERTMSDLVIDIGFSIKTRIQYIKQEISSKRKAAFDRRQDSISRLSEAVVVAKSLNIISRLDDTGGQAVSSAGVAINTADIPLYMRGTQALNAEIQVLKKRVSDDPFIRDLRGLEERLVELESISIDREQLSPVTLDKLALPPYEPKSPKLVLVLAIGLVLAVFSGLFGVFLTHAYRLSKQKVEVTTG